MNDVIAIWSLLVGLAMIFVGGMVLWAYGGRPASSTAKYAETGVEAEATRRFHSRLARWFFTYGSMLMTAGLALLLWAASVALS